MLLELRRLHPEAQYVYTHYSPSAEALARRLPVDAADYLPYDLPAAAERLLDALAPSLLVFSKLDLWPELATRAADPRRGGRDGGGHGESGKRAAALARADPARARAIARWGSPPPCPTRTPRGWPGWASPPIASRSSAIRASTAWSAGLGQSTADEPLLRFGRGAPTLVAGSTWPGDEAVLLDAFARVHAGAPDARLILVPHEPTPRAPRGGGRRGAPRRAAGSGAAERGDRARAAAAGGSGRRPGDPLRRGHHGLRRRRVRAGGPAFGAGAGGVGRAGGVRAALEARAGTRRCCCEAGGAVALTGRGSAAGEELCEIWRRWIERRRRSGRPRASRARRWWSAGGEPPGGRPRCWPKLFRHDPFERHRPRDDEPQREPGDQHVAPPAPHPDPQVRDAAPAGELSRQRLPERRLLVPQQSPEAEDRLAADREAVALGGWPAGDATVAGTPSVVASKVWAHPASSERASSAGSARRGRLTGRAL